MEGHRFAVRAIEPGQPLLSWGLPFGLAVTPVKPGDYVCNAKILNTLRHRQIDFTLPDAANFEDHIRPYELDPAGFAAAEQVAKLPAGQRQTFLGYARPGGRGVGTRNMIVLLGTSFAQRQLCAQSGGAFRAA